MRPYLVFACFFAICFSSLNAQKFEPRGEKKNEIGLKFISLESPNQVNLIGAIRPRIEFINGISYRRYFKGFTVIGAFSTLNAEFLSDRDFQCADCDPYDFFIQSYSFSLGGEKYFKLGRWQPFLYLGAKGTLSNGKGYQIDKLGAYSAYARGSQMEKNLTIEGGLGTRYYFTPILSMQLHATYGYGWSSIKSWDGYNDFRVNERQSTNSGLLAYPSVQLAGNIAF